MTEILSTNSEIVVIIEENDESTLVAQMQEVTTVIEMEPGVPGEQGEPGQDGAPGADGADGLSAYQIAVANGFAGNEAEWLVSLQGADGLDGSDGIDGQDGKSAYQSYLDTTTDDPVKSEEEWASLQVDHTHEIADVTGLQTALDGKGNMDLLGSYEGIVADADMPQKKGEAVIGTKTIAGNIIGKSLILATADVASELDYSQVPLGVYELDIKELSMSYLDTLIVLGGGATKAFDASGNIVITLPATDATAKINQTVAPGSTILPRTFSSIGSGGFYQFTYSVAAPGGNGGVVNISEIEVIHGMISHYWSPVWNTTSKSWTLPTLSSLTGWMLYSGRFLQDWNGSTFTQSGNLNLLLFGGTNYSYSQALENSPGVPLMPIAGRMVSLSSSDIVGTSPTQRIIRVFNKSGGGGTITTPASSASHIPALSICNKPIFAFGLRNLVGATPVTVTISKLRYVKINSNIPVNNP